MFRFKLIICLMLFFGLASPMRQAVGSEIDRRVVFVGAILGLTTVSVAAIFWDQLKQQYAAISVSVMLMTTLYAWIKWNVVLFENWAHLEPVMHSQAPIWTPLPQIVTAVPCIHPPAGRRIRDMARLPYS